MEEIKEKFQKIQRSKDAQEINDFLIDLSKNLSKDSVIIIEFIIDNFDLPLIEKIKLNLIYLIGEIGKNYSIEEKFYNYLLENFFTSDRWVREEILLSLIKISKNLIDTNELWKVLNFALNEEYKPIKLNALKLVLNFKTIPYTTLNVLLKTLGSNDSEILENALYLFEKNVPKKEELFEFLTNEDRYKSVNKPIIRSLLVTYFNSINDLKNYKKKILESHWDKQYKTFFVNEINVYQNIIAKINDNC